MREENRRQATTLLVTGLQHPLWAAGCLNRWRNKRAAKRYMFLDLVIASCRVTLTSDVGEGCLDAPDAIGGHGSCQDRWVRQCRLCR